MHFARIVVCILPIFLHAACAEVREGAAPPSSGNPTIMVIAYPLEIPALGVLHTLDALAGQVQTEMIFLPLLRFDADMQPIPWLAASWDTVGLAGDSLLLTFHLRDDVVWHDGTATDAADVRFTFERVMDPRTGSLASRHFSLYNPEVEVLAPLSVRFRVKASGGFLDGWAIVPPLPRHLLEHVPPEDMAMHPFGGSPTGNGPFRFVRRIAGQEWVFAAYDAFPIGLGGRPLLDRVVIRTVPDETARLTQLITGTVDLVRVGEAQLERVLAAPDLRLLEVHAPNWTAVFWNTRIPRFADPRVRRALTLAIDREAIRDAVLHGRGAVGRSVVPPFHDFFLDSDPGDGPDYDPQAARQLFAAAGWRDSGDGILRDDDGTGFALTLSVIATLDEHRNAAQIIQAQLRRIGIRVQLRLVEYNALLRLAGSATGPERGFDALVMSVSGALRKDDALLFHSRHRDDPAHLSGFSTPEVDRILDDLAASTDHSRDIDIWHDYQRIMLRESPVTVLYYPVQFIGVAGRIDGPAHGRRGMLHGIATWRSLDG